jgi:hypothetical protein
MLEFTRIKSHQVATGERDCDERPLMAWANTTVYINPVHVVAASRRDEREGQLCTLILETVDGSDHLFAGTDQNLQSFYELIQKEAE